MLLCTTLSTSKLNKVIIFGSCFEGNAAAYSEPSQASNMCSYKVGKILEIKLKWKVISIYKFCIAQWIFACSKSTIETQEQDGMSVWS